MAADSCAFVPIFIINNYIVYNKKAYLITSLSHEVNGKLSQNVGMKSTDFHLIKEVKNE